MRLAQRQRHVIEQYHLVAADVDELVVLRMQRTDRVEAVDGQLVQGDQVFAVRIHGVAFHRHQVADVVVDGQGIQHLAFAVIPLGDLRVHVDGGVDDAGLGVVLGMQRPQADLHRLVQGVLHGDDRDAVGVLALEFTLLDGVHDLVEAVDPGMAVELAGDDDVLAVR